MEGVAGGTSSAFDICFFFCERIRVGRNVDSAVPSEGKFVVPICESVRQMT